MHLVYNDEISKNEFVNHFFIFFDTRVHLQKQQLVGSGIVNVVGFTNLYLAFIIVSFKDTNYLRAKHSRSL